LARKGIIVRVAGVVVDVEFASGNLPSIQNALFIEREEGGTGQDLVVEVQEHLDGVCTRIMGQVAPEQVHHSLVEQLTDRIWEMGRKEMEQVETLRRSLGDRPSTVYITSARDLSKEEQRELVRTFSAVADRNMSVDLEVDPALAAGLRVRIGDMVVDNSLAKQVSELHGQIAEALEDVARG
jgi:F-type H+-transporting ATPase subunit b